MCGFCIEWKTVFKTTWKYKYSFCEVLWQWETSVTLAPGHTPSSPPHSLSTIQYLPVSSLLASLAYMSNQQLVFSPQTPSFYPAVTVGLGDLCMSHIELGDLTKSYAIGWQLRKTSYEAAVKSGWAVCVWHRHYLKWGLAACYFPQVFPRINHFTFVE